MKRWQVCANENIKGIKVDSSEKLKMVVIINEIWEAFAKTGDCNCSKTFVVSCDYCPFRETDLCGIKTYKRRKKVLNEEVSVMSMKEVKEWSGEAREMWVWDDDEKSKKKAFVVYIESSAMDGESRVLTARTGKYFSAEWFKHCAEIEEECEPKMMTNKELSRWLRANPTREYRVGESDNNNVAYCYRDYYIDQADDMVPDNLFIREGDGKWKKPYKLYLTEPLYKEGEE